MGQTNNHESKQEPEVTADDKRLKSEEDDYATPGENRMMDLMNPRVIEQLREVMDSLHSMKKRSALEVACGASHVTRELLLDRFAQVDLFD